MLKRATKDMVVVFKSFSKVFTNVSDWHSVVHRPNLGNSSHDPLHLVFQGLRETQEISWMRLTSGRRHSNAAGRRGPGGTRAANRVHVGGHPPPSSAAAPPGQPARPPHSSPPSAKEMNCLPVTHGFHKVAMAALTSKTHHRPSS